MKVRSGQEVGTRVRALRHERGLTQGELARRMGVSRKWVSDLEGGKGSVAMELVLRAVAVLGAEFDLRERSDQAEADLNAIIEAHRRR